MSTNKYYNTFIYCSSTVDLKPSPPSSIRTEILDSDHRDRVEEPPVLHSSLSHPSLVPSIEPPDPVDGPVASGLTSWKNDCMVRQMWEKREDPHQTCRQCYPVTPLSVLTHSTPIYHSQAEIIVWSVLQYLFFFVLPLSTCLLPSPTFLWIWEFLSSWDRSVLQLQGIPEIVQRGDNISK